MNKTELAYANRLELFKKAGQIEDFAFEGLTFKLADDTRYTPDFFIVRKERFEFHEVKGFFRDDAKVKIKVAAKMFPWFKFVLVQYQKGEWKFTDY
jgi:hypothetical protein